jgi:putative acetyltransferase
MILPAGSAWSKAQMYRFCCASRTRREAIRGSGLAWYLSTKGDNLVVDIRLAESPGDLAIVRQLWGEYWESLGLPMDFQGFGEEVQSLPGVYAALGGALLVAFDSSEPAGTIALRRLGANSGEVKRLYLRPKFRGRGLGRRLLETIIDRATAVPYDCLYADTLPSMMEALSLYARGGFARVEAYSNTPTPGAIYLKLKLPRASEPRP